VPTYVELANESGISPVTLSRIANGHIKQLNLSVLDSLITSLRRRGFATEISDLLVYHADGVNDELRTGEMMKAFGELSHLELNLKQPSARKKEYELRAGSELVGTLRWPKALFSLCVAETAAGSWTFDRKGFFNSRVTARVTASEQELLIYTLNWTGAMGTMKHIDGREFTLQGANWWGNHFKLMQKPPQGEQGHGEQGHGEQGKQGEEIELLAVKIHFSILRESADVTIQPQLAQAEDGALLTMFSCYLAVMAYEEMASGGTF
jgi:DNA-binding Xre family transcriptional regulator